MSGSGWGGNGERLLPDTPVLFPRKKRRQRRRRCYAPPARSARLYVTLDPSTVHMFRFLLEAQDHLGIMTVVDRRRAALMVRFSPLQERELRDFLEGMRETVPFCGPFEIASRDCVPTD